MQSTIVLLIPVLGRPHNAAPLVESIQAATSVSHKIIFICSPGDKEQKNACWLTGAITLVVDWDPGPGDYAKKINLGFRRTKEPFVFLGADDLRFERGWDTAALELAEKTGASVIGTQDGGNGLVKKGQHATHSLVRRLYIQKHGGTFTGEKGIVYCEEYDHQLVDNELVAVAKSRKQWAFSSESFVEHLHPFWHKGKLDSTYEKALRRGKEDIALYQQREHIYLMQ